MEGQPDEVSKEFGAATCDLFGLTVFGEYFERICPYRLEQPPATGRCRSVRCHQRLGDQICDLFEKNGSGATLVAHHGIYCFERKTSGENTQSAQQAPFCVRQ
jgi:hypothetical protein